MLQKLQGRAAIYPNCFNRILKNSNKKFCPKWIIRDVLALERNLAATKQYGGD
jgi:hypothetical protein